MKQYNFSYPSASPGKIVSAYCWTPDAPEEAKAIIQLCHGISEYALRYTPFAEFLVDRGYIVAANDHLGHGSTARNEEENDYFSDTDGWLDVASDAAMLCAQMKKRMPGVPVYLFGHSMGSFVARTCLIRWPDEWEKAILCGTGQQPLPALAAGRTLLALLCAVRGARERSPFAYNLIFGAYNRHFAPNRTECDWLSLDEENVDRYLADPRCGRMPRLGLLRDMLSGIRMIERPENLRRMNRELPVLFIAGEDDPVGNYGKGVRQAYASFRKAGMQHLSLHLEPKARHEILNDFCREEIMQRIADFCDAGNG